MLLEKTPQIQALTAAEKLLLVTEFWDDLSAQPEKIPVSAETIAELDRRMEHYRRHPEQATTWEKAKARIQGRQ